MQNAIFYHIYPLGLCGAPRKNDFTSQPVPRLEMLHEWIPHLREMNVNTLYLGPVFESTAHGYDTADFFRVDRRLGTNETLSRLSEALHQNGIRLVLDAVFHHVDATSGHFVIFCKTGKTLPIVTGSAAWISVNAVHIMIHLRMMVGQVILIS